MRIIDDDFMRKILSDTDCVQLVLRIIMNKSDLIVKDVQIQYDMKNLQGLSLRLDVLADRVRYFKETEEGVKDMCEIMEEIREEGISVGTARANRLAQKLIDDGRMEDFVNSLNDREYQEQLFLEFGI